MRFRCGSQAIRVLRMSAAVRRTVARHAAVISCAGGGVPMPRPGRMRRRRRTVTPCAASETPPIGPKAGNPTSLRAGVFPSDSPPSRRQRPRPSAAGLFQRPGARPRPRPPRPSAAGCFSVWASPSRKQSRRSRQSRLHVPWRPALRKRLPDKGRRCYSGNTPWKSRGIVCALRDDDVHLNLRNSSTDGESSKVRRFGASLCSCSVEGFSGPRWSAKRRCAFLRGCAPGVAARIGRVPVRIPGKRLPPGFFRFCRTGEGV